MNEQRFLPMIFYLMLFAPQVSIVEKADSSSVLPCPVSISTKNKMNFLFANLKDRDFLVQRISDFLQRTPDSSWGDTSPLSLIGHLVCHLSAVKSFTGNRT